MWRVGPTPDTATEVLFDQLDLLMTALSDQGASYHVVMVNQLTDLALPGTSIAVRYTDRDVLLMRSDLKAPSLHLSDVHANLFKTRFVFNGLPILQGWISAMVHTGNGHFRLALTHLESPVPGVPESVDVQTAQASELVKTFSNTTDPVVICGDFNSDANGGNGPDATPSAALIVEAGYTDVWTHQHPGDAGPTWPLYLEDQPTIPDFFAPSEPFERIDLFFSKGLQATAAERVLAPSGSAGLPDFGSDHAGVLATFQP